MKRTLFVFLISSVIIATCSPKENADESEIPEVQATAKPICFNHAVLVLDSATYFAAINSEFINQFAFSQERQLDGYKGFYLFGKTNYIELFHPESFDGYEEEVGGIWVCLASLQSNYLQNLNTEKLSFVEYNLDDQFHDLSLKLNDSISLISTWEMTEMYYESWTKKTFSDSMKFLPVDYNSPQDSVSSTNYLMNDLIGIGLSIHPTDSSKVIRYLKEVGFDSCSTVNGRPRMSNNHQFFELDFSENRESPTIRKIYIRLNESVQPTTETIGNSNITCDGKLAIWTFELF